MKRITVITELEEALQALMSVHVREATAIIAEVKSALCIEEKTARNSGGWTT